MYLNKDASHSHRRWLALSGLVFIGLAVHLSCRSSSSQPFTEEGLIYDLIWLDAWALSFLLTMVSVWLGPFRAGVRARLLVGAYALFGAIGIIVILHGTWFSLGGFGGDQLFRTAMVLKFQEFLRPVDFFYKGLPTFYPPVYYGILALGARLCSFEAFQTLKIGSIGIYFFGPWLLYWMWRRLVTPTQAALATLFTFLFSSLGNPLPLVAPHAFLANSFFIPWWLHYVEQIGAKDRSRKFYLVGGLTGATIFMTYYFPFFIGGLLLAMRAVAWRYGSIWLNSTPPRFRWLPSLTVLGLVAVFSSPFWGPLVWSLVTIGNDATQQEWHHINSTGIKLKFVEFSFAGAIFLAALIHAARRHAAPLFKGFLLLIGSVVVFGLIGSVLGAIDRPVALIKSREFVALLGGPLIGLALASWLRFGTLSSRKRATTLIVTGSIVLALLNGFIGSAKSGGVKSARQTKIPNWHLEATEMQQRRGSVFLTAHHALPAFYPVYTFLFANQHYAHPAALYTERFEFLQLLQSAPDPALFHLALRHNRFNAVDYFMPVVRNNQMEIYANRSNYPNKFDKQTLRFPTRLIADTSLFVPETGDHLYRLVEAVSNKRIDSSDPESIDWLQQLRPYLTIEGVRQLEQHLARTLLDSDQNDDHDDSR